MSKVEWQKRLLEQYDPTSAEVTQQGYPPRKAAVDALSLPSFPPSIHSRYATTDDVVCRF